MSAFLFDMWQMNKIYMMFVISPIGLYFNLHKLLGQFRLERVDGTVVKLIITKISKVEVISRNVICS